VFHGLRQYLVLISSEVFSQRADENFTVTADDLTKCGANFDPNIKVNNTNLDRPDIIKVEFSVKCFVDD
jgi:hypothetical protein